ncbi:MULTISPECIES: hypothetical protein [unclassified Pseudomonas]|uniref:hypothetical protein n=1 Tax=unclassified Pseudomonas TaxID=196821 RepID=UPI000487B14A|nr:MULTISPECIES: hypothetical protein [unclassified Pseudomonas]PXX72619.1 hypothetical protein D906_00606 [Pseudomonas sp. LAIL14HWK12:I1]SOC95661.1 hypothetical protein SAMN05660198_00610 [Pseudomonas sp. LAIL14HWK12:I3]
MFIKFEYLKFSGCLEDIRVFEHLSGFVQVIMKVDGVLIPNVKVPIQIYEDLEKGSHVEFYALVQNSKNKVKNTAIVLAAKTASGRLLRVPSMRYKVQLHFWVIAAIWAAVAFVLSWIALVFGVDFFIDGRSTWGFINSAASVTGLLTGGFFVGCGIYLFHKTSVLDTWKSIAPSLLVERFSKLHR